jgi:hypothetical protein
MPVEHRVCDHELLEEYSALYRQDGGELAQEQGGHDRNVGHLATEHEIDRRLWH